MLGQLVLLAGLLAVAVATIAATVLVGIRARLPLAIDAMRRFSRLFNAMQMRTAGTPGASASVVRHRGRASGRSYETPVGAVATEDGFVIALPYGSRANWLRNVLASGSATIVNEGRAYPVDQPEVIPLESVATRFSAADQRSHRLFRVDQCLRVRRVESAEAA
jgi:hypothetical protein